MKALASNVRKLRKARGWTQEDLAAAVKIEQATVSLLENGRANPTLLVLGALARALEVRLSDLFESHGRGRRGRSDDPPSK